MKKSKILGITLIVAGILGMISIVVFAFLNMIGIWGAWIIFLFSIPFGIGCYLL